MLPMKHTGYFLFSALIGIIILAGTSGCDGGKGSCDQALEDGLLCQDLVRECRPGDINASQNYAAGLLCLNEGQPEGARPYFESIESSAGEYDSAQYALLMVEVQKVGDWAGVIAGLLPSLMGLLEGFGAPFSPQQLDLWGMVFEEMIQVDELLDIMVAIRDRATQMIQNGWTLELQEFPILIGAEDEDLYVRVTANGTAGTLEARILVAIADMVISWINYLSAHSFEINLTALSHITELLSTDFAGADMIGLMRDFAWLAAENPTFLSSHPVRWSTNIPAMKSQIAAAVPNIKELDTTLISTAVPRATNCARAVCLVDRDGSGTISEGDRAFVNMQIHVFYQSDFILEADLSNEMILTMGEVMVV